MLPIKKFNSDSNYWKKYFWKRDSGSGDEIIIMWKLYYDLDSTSLEIYLLKLGCIGVILSPRLLFSVG